MTFHATRFVLCTIVFICLTTLTASQNIICTNDKDALEAAIVAFPSGIDITPYECKKENFSCNENTCADLTFSKTCYYSDGAGGFALSSDFTKCSGASPTGLTSTGNYYDYDFPCCSLSCSPFSSPSPQADTDYNLCDADYGFNLQTACTTPTGQATRTLYCKVATDVFSTTPSNTYYPIAFTQAIPDKCVVQYNAVRYTSTLACSSPLCSSIPSTINISSPSFDVSNFECTQTKFPTCNAQCATVEYLKTCYYYDTASQIFQTTSDFTLCDDINPTGSLDGDYFKISHPCCAVYCSSIATPSSISDYTSSCEGLIGFTDLLATTTCSQQLYSRSIYCKLTNDIFDDTASTFSPISFDPQGVPSTCTTVYDQTLSPPTVQQNCQEPTTWTCHSGTTTLSNLQSYTSPLPVTLADDCNLYCQDQANTAASCLEIGNLTGAAFSTHTPRYYVSTTKCLQPVCTSARCNTIKISSSTPDSLSLCSETNDPCTISQCSFDNKPEVYGACYTKDNTDIWSISTTKTDCDQFTSVINSFDVNSSNFIYFDGVCFQDDICTQNCARDTVFGTSTSSELIESGNLFLCADVDTKFTSNKGIFTEVEVSCDAYGYSYYKVRYLTSTSSSSTPTNFLKQIVSVDTSSAGCSLQCYNATTEKWGACTSNCTSCSVCRNPAAPSYAFNAADNCAAMTSTCDCIASCSSSSETLQVGSPAPAGTITCTANSFRSVDSYCLIDTITPSSVRQVFCTYSNGSIFSIDAATDCNWTQVETVPWPSSTTDCTYSYQCGNDPEDLSQCSCPGGANKDQCEDSTIWSSEIISCAVKHTSSPISFTTQSNKCCEKQGSTSLDTTPGSNCVCPCLQFEWHCTCYNAPDSTTPTQGIPCDCETPTSTPNTCPFDCRSYKVEKTCWDTFTNAAAVPNTSCDFIQTIPPSSYSCTPADELIAANTCKNAVQVSCWNNNAESNALYDCSTCVDVIFDTAPATATRATTRNISCSVIFDNIDGTPEATPRNIPCNSATASAQKTCVGAFTLTAPTSTASRGDELTYTWSYIGPIPSIESYTLQTITDVPVPTTDLVFPTPDNNGATSTVLYSASQFKYTTPKDVAMPFDSFVFSTSSTTPLAKTTIDFFCDKATPTCIDQYCTAEDRVCGTAGSCVIDANTSFTSCKCNGGFAGDGCQFDKICTDSGFCNAHGNALSFGASPSGQCSVGSTTCSCTAAWTGTQCNTCIAATLAQRCIANHFVPLASSKQCDCVCFAGYGGRDCSLRVIYASVISSIAPSTSTITLGTNYETAIDTATLSSTNPAIAVYLNGLATNFRSATSIASIIVIEVRTVTGQTNQYEYILRWNYDAAVDTNAQWRTYQTHISSPYIISPLATSSPQNSVISTTAAYDPVCVAEKSTGCPTGASFYPTAVSPIICDAASTDPNCQTEFTDAPVTPNDSGSGGGDGLSGGIIAIIVIFSILGAALIVGLLVYCYCRSRTQSQSSDKSDSSKQKKQKSGFVNQDESEPFPFQDTTTSSTPAKKSRASSNALSAPTAPNDPYEQQTHTKKSSSGTPTRPIAPSDPKKKKDIELTENRKSSRRMDSDKSLPHPWKECCDHLGNVYYMNMVTMETTFSRPNV